MSYESGCFHQKVKAVISVFRSCGTLMVFLCFFDFFDLYSRRALHYRSDVIRGARGAVEMLQRNLCRKD